MELGQCRQMDCNCTNSGMKRSTVDLGRIPSPPAVPWWNTSSSSPSHIRNRYNPRKLTWYTQSNTVALFCVSKIYCSHWKYIRFCLFLRSSNKNLLIVPDIRSEMGPRSFSFASPSIWNSHPQHIRSSDSLSAFRGSSRSSYIKSLFHHSYQ